MSFSFEEEQIITRAANNSVSGQSKMVDWLINKGWFKTPKGASVFLVVVIIVCLLLSVAALNFRPIFSFFGGLF